jgi:transcription initiation factor TFIIIB Brf1 subunit/transcription initiation factor TFIIB
MTLRTCPNCGTQNREAETYYGGPGRQYCSACGWVLV